MVDAQNLQMAVARTDRPAHRQLSAGRAFAIAIVAAAFCGSTGQLTAEGFQAPTGVQPPRSAHFRPPTSEGFRPPSFAPVVDNQFRLAGGPGLLPVVGPSFTSANANNSGNTGPSNFNGPSFEQLLDRLDRQDQVIANLQQRLDGQRSPAVVPAWPASTANTSAYAGTSSATYFGEPPCGCPQPPKVYAPLVGNADDGSCVPCGRERSLKEQHVVSHYVGYDKGFVFRPFNSREYPFDLKFNGRIQFRHHGFARDVDTWTNNAGVTRPVENRNRFDVERARLILSGTVLDPRMSFFLQVDGDSDGRHAVDFFDYWWAWRFGDALQVQVGKRKVPGSRQWLSSAFDTMFVARSVATNFFRPDRTIGIWFVGDITDNMHYEAMIGNGYRTTNLNLTEQNDKLAGAFTHWIDLGDSEFGTTFADYEWHDTPAMRVGHSFTAADQSGTSGGVPLGESDFVRLTDGTILDAPNALAPNTRVTEFDIYMYSIDAAWKYDGYSINGELFFRWLEQIDGTGNIPVNEIFDHGYYVQGSVYLIPKTMYVAARISNIDGPYGDHYEYAAAVNWFVNGSRNLKLTFDVTSLDGSPLNNPSPDIQVGDDGLLFRTQFQAKF